MTLLAEVPTLLRWPDFYLRQHLVAPPAVRQLLGGLVLPLAALQSLVELVRSLWLATPLVGAVLAQGGLALQVGTWAALGLGLPTLARQVGADIDERRAFALVTYGLVPSWLAGVFYAVPESAAIFFFWSRVLFFIASLAGLAIVHRGTLVLEVPLKSRWPLVLGLAVAGITVYLVLFLVLGISSHVALFLLGARAS